MPVCRQQGHGGAGHLRSVEPALAGDRPDASATRRRAVERGLEGGGLARGDVVAVAAGGRAREGALGFEQGPHHVLRHEAPPVVLVRDHGERACRGEGDGVRA